MTTTPKERIHDDQIVPLMEQIIAICKKHKIGLVCSFDLGPDQAQNGEHKACTTALLGEEYDPDERHLAAVREILKYQPRIIRRDSQ